MTTKTGLTRNTIDKYYTKDEIVNECLKSFSQNVNFHQDDLIIEPSAGNGAFINGIKSLTTNYIFYDIEPEHPEITQQNYLNCYCIHSGRIHIIGNPPFGRQSSLAIQFIKKSCEIASSISFILPKSFKKESLKKAFQLNFHLIYQFDLPFKSFIIGGEEYDVPCIFQIWEKREYPRLLPPVLTPNKFKFVDKFDSPTISFRRIGANAGAISTDIESKSSQSHYFIKFESIIPNLEILSNIQYDFDNTVGPKSISKQELIAKFNPILNTS